MMSLEQQQRQFEVNTNNSNSTMTNANYVTPSNHPSTTTTTTTTADSVIQAIAIAYDPELSPIPDQQAYAVLDLYGNIVRSSSSTSTSSSSRSNGGGEGLIKDAPILYKMIVESTSLVLASAAGQEQEEKRSGSAASAGLNRMTITFDNAAIRYIIARDENHIYLIQTSTTK
ncbi:hypothetical protein FRACYDRAFT_271858 [Fragilariopsis cylindrus CCMP1102]|uniref:Uncharacterized protein n=1 Tax=Fragilariopsis cylindrus CCMP1102 TaxID=635003 RepID=A0A1E7ERH8_9STRA|nr:hypothetical protein FRACYDRAFT_271858 [Fragilariopsis cylindrus CCMP1102]|eukprot:OEU08153.1 hypothetical protein FRACYDRAFT_271858 [Fragilariopsis cylindrus CCMP1102]